MRYLFYTLFAASPLTADLEISDNAPPAAPVIVEPSEQLKGNTFPALYNASARIDTAGPWDFFFYGSLIYWLPVEEGLELGLVDKRTPGGVNTPNLGGKIVNMDFSYEVGFKAGIGMDLHHDNWSAFFEFTRLHTNQRSRFTSENSADFLVPFWLDAANTGQATRAESVWHLNYNLFDFSIARSYYHGTHLVMSPFFGLRGGWISQKYEASYDIFQLGAAPFTNKESEVSSDSWLAGLRAGVDSEWLLGLGFRLFGNLAGSFCYTQFKSHMEQDSVFTAVDTDELTMRSKKRTVRPNAEAGIGFGWGGYFNEEKCHFDIAGSYDFNMFWNQNYLKFSQALLSARTTQNPASLYLHGLTLKAQFDF